MGQARRATRRGERFDPSEPVDARSEPIGSNLAVLVAWREKQFLSLLVLASISAPPGRCCFLI